MSSIKRILCPIDFSEFSKHAFDRAVAVARHHKASVIVLHVAPLPSGVAAVPFLPGGPGPFALQALDRQQVVRDMRRLLAIEKTSDVPVECQVLEAPSVLHEILEQADSLGADLIVMGTHGRSGFDRLLLGSVTERVLRRAKVPVLTVPSHALDVVPRVDAPFMRVLCGVDFSASSLNALTHAASFARESGARLTLLHVVELLPVVYEPSMAAPFDPGQYWPALERASRAQLHRIVPHSVRQTCDVEEIVTSGKSYVEILKTAEERHADLIVLGAQGHNALDRLLVGSTAEHVVRRASCPVLTVRQSAAEK